MAYGVNSPNGIIPVSSLTSSPYSGQTNTYLIKSGYTNNIYRGDVVIVAGPGDAGGDYTGYIVSLADALDGTTGALQTTALLGVFNGCSYKQPFAQNTVAPNLPARPMWPANQLTLNNVPAVAFVADDPMLVFQAQISNVSMTQSLVMQAASIAITKADGLVDGNNLTGQSKMGLNLPVAGSPATWNFLVTSVAPYPSNAQAQIPNIPTGPTYPIVNGLILNHQFMQRAAPRT